jgi:hypothetical protein
MKLVVVILLGLTLAGCAAMRRNEAESTGNLLAAAGFKPQFADEPEERAKLDQMKPLALVRRDRNGETLYTYADPYFCKCVYVGTQPQYAEYQRMAFQKQIADESVMAAEANEDAAMAAWWWW